jgi:hypothetical protein
VTICNFKLWPNKLESGRFKVPMLSRWRMQEQHSKKVGLPQVQYTFLELPKYAGGDNPQTMIDKWAYFFREAKNLNVVPPALEGGPFREALDIARLASFSAAEWEAYDRAKMAEQDARGALSVAHQEGETVGQAKAILKVLVTRGIAVPERLRARILECSDAATLDRWLIRAVTARSAEDVVESS